MVKDKKNKNKAARVIAIVGAWVSVVVFGVGMIWLTTTIGQSVSGASLYTDQNFAGSVVLNGISGLLILSITLLVVWRFRKTAFFFQFIVGLWIGLGLYGLILVTGIITHNTPKTTANQCTSPLDQYRRFGAAIVPIQTNLGVGTGFLVDNNGTVLTANHVVKDSTEQHANYASGKIALKIVDQAEEYDLAVLKLERFGETHLPLSDSYNIGDSVFAFGYPGNAYTAGAPSITAGIISRLLNTEDLRLTKQDTPTGFSLIQTDAAINPGNSGGPLIGACGVVGIIVAVSDSARLSSYVGAVSEQGIGYAVSVRSAAQRFKLPLYTP